MLKIIGIKTIILILYWILRRSISLILKKKYLDWEGETDENNIPLYLGIDGNKYYSTIFLGHYAIGAYQVAIDENDNKAKECFLNICLWFISNQETYKECSGLWLNRYEMKFYHLENEWQSSLSQAFGISCLVRAYYLTNQVEYLNSAIIASRLIL